MELIVLFGGAVGSLVTILVTKLFELTQSAREQRFAVRKEVFVRQLVIGERAAARMLRLYDSVSDEIAFCRINASHDAPDEYMVRLRERIDAAREYTADLKNSTYPFWLYFDVEKFVSFPDELSLRLHNARMVVGLAFDKWYDLHTNELAEQSSRESNISAAKQELRDAYKELEAVLQDVRQHYLQALWIMKSEILKVLQSPYAPPAQQNTPRQPLAPNENAAGDRRPGMVSPQN